jgi:DNA-binding protein HU-beta
MRRTFITMTKAQLITAIAEEVGISRVAIGKALNAFMDRIEKELKSNGHFGVTGFGKLMLVKRKARKGRNPRTGASITIPAKNVVRFKAGRRLAARIMK